VGKSEFGGEVGHQFSGAKDLRTAKFKSIGPSLRSG
jgi:hypothetical protein